MGLVKAFHAIVTCNFGRHKYSDKDPCVCVRCGYENHTFTEKSTEMDYSDIHESQRPYWQAPTLPPSPSTLTKCSVCGKPNPTYV